MADLNVASIEKRPVERMGFLPYFYTVVKCFRVDELLMLGFSVMPFVGFEEY